MADIIYLIIQLMHTHRGMLIDYLRIIGLILVFHITIIAEVPGTSQFSMSMLVRTLIHCNLNKAAIIPDQ